MHQGFVLRPGVSFCEASGRLIFLDLIADRYFALEAEPEAAFRHILTGNPERAAPQQLDSLIRGGLLHAAPKGEAPRPCPHIAPPRTSLLDGNLPKASAGEVLRATGDLLETRLRLALRGIAAVLDRLATRKASANSAPVGDRLDRIAAAFEASARLTRSHDQCLIRSAAAAMRLASLDMAVDLVIGVRIRPFAAHCWVQAKDGLVNDRHDTVRAYTPILLI